MVLKCATMWFQMTFLKPSFVPWSFSKKMLIGVWQDPEQGLELGRSDAQWCYMSVDFPKGYRQQPWHAGMIMIVWSINNVNNCTLCCYLISLFCFVSHRYSFCCGYLWFLDICLPINLHFMNQQGPGFQLIIFFYVQVKKKSSTCRMTWG